MPAGASTAAQRPDLTCRRPQFGRSSKPWSSTASPLAAQRRIWIRVPTAAPGQGEVGCQLGPACFTDALSNSTANQSLAPIATKPMPRSGTLMPSKRLFLPVPVGASREAQAWLPTVVRLSRFHEPGVSAAVTPVAKPLGRLPSFGPPTERDQLPSMETHSTSPVRHIWSTRVPTHAEAPGLRPTGILKATSMEMSCHSFMPRIDTGPRLPPSLQPMGSSGTICRMTLLVLPLSLWTSKTPIWSAHHFPSWDSA
mmetsp:Transcript_15387/g.46119  ORF Transcript_15387/g.46119 Transcript_15387/m.46119 type:complete len:254 (+) Transcript_15387:511-1272(+)